MISDILHSLVYKQHICSVENRHENTAVSNMFRDEYYYIIMKLHMAVNKLNAKTSHQLAIENADQIF